VDRYAFAVEKFIRQATRNPLGLGTGPWDISVSNRERDELDTLILASVLLTRNSQLRNLVVFQ
jgi:hypothetical protein